MHYAQNCQKTYQMAGSYFQDEQHPKDCTLLDTIGKWKRGQPKTTWRTVSAELKKLKLSWAEAEKSAKDRTGQNDIADEAQE